MRNSFHLSQLQNLLAVLVGICLILVRMYICSYVYSVNNMVCTCLYIVYLQQHLSYMYLHTYTQVM